MVEVSMKNFILANFVTRNSVNIGSLTVSNIQDIILGQEISAYSVQRKEWEKSLEAQVTAASLE